MGAAEGSQAQGALAPAAKRVLPRSTTVEAPAFRPGKQEYAKEGLQPRALCQATPAKIYVL